MELNRLPMFYQKPVPLNKETHNTITIGPSPNGFKFTAKTQTVLLTTVEFFDAGRQFPIIFTATPDGRILPVALLGLENGENLFVNESGAWTGDYIPAYIRRYPFITTEAIQGEMTICFDEMFDGLNQEGGTKLFENGEPTQKVTEIQAFLQDYFIQMQQTEQFGAMLSPQIGLLKQIDATVNLNDGKTYNLIGMLVVDEQKLIQLPDTEIVRLFRNGQLAMIHAHLMSLRNLGNLIERKSLRNIQTVTDNVSNPEISDSVEPVSETLIETAG